MTKSAFRLAGARVLESLNGDLMISDRDVEMDMIITNEIMKRAKDDPEKMKLIGEQFVKFYEKYKEERWNKVKLRLVEIGEEDAPWVQYRKNLLTEKTVGNLKILERDIFFWREDHGKNAEDKLKKLGNIKK